MTDNSNKNAPITGFVLLIVAIVAALVCDGLKLIPSKLQPKVDLSASQLLILPASAIAFAKLEHQIEGVNGWAANLRGQPTSLGLNTYHVWLATTMLLVFHLAYYCDGKRVFTLKNEQTLLINYVALFLLEDWSWFALWDPDKKKSGFVGSTLASNPCKSKWHKCTKAPLRIPIMYPALVAVITLLSMGSRKQLILLACQIAIVTVMAYVLRWGGMHGSVEQGTNRELGPPIIPATKVG